MKTKFTIDFAGVNSVAVSNILMAIEKAAKIAELSISEDNHLFTGEVLQERLGWRKRLREIQYQATHARYQPESGLHE